MKCISALVLCFIMTAAAAQSHLPGGWKKSFDATLESAGALSTSGRTPFWLFANQYGTVPAKAPMATVRLGLAGVLKSDTTEHPSWELNYGVEGVATFASPKRFLLAQSYAKVKAGSLMLLAGRQRQTFGLVDSTLSLGSYSWSANALPLHRIQFGTDGYMPLKFTAGILAVNAFWAHGWFAKTDSMKHSYLHQKAIYGRIGKPNWRIKLYGGMLHSVQWGGQSDHLNNGSSRNGQLPSSFQDYVAVVAAGKPPQNESLSFHDRVNQVGNHLGQLDIGAEMKVRSGSFMMYYQHPFEDKSGLAMYNLPDGLYGFRWINEKKSSATFHFYHVLAEYLTTMSQSGSTLKVGNGRYDGIDDYFNNFQYIDGWSHHHRVLGTPYISRRQDVKPQLSDLPGEYKLTVVNNRVKVLSLAAKGRFASGIDVKLAVSYSSNYGLYRTPFPGKAGQLSTAVWCTYPLPEFGNSQIQAALAVDQGQLLPNSVAGWISWRRTFSLKK